MLRALPHTQRGSLLLVTLILLVLMTMVGLGAAVSTMLETKLSANQYDRMMAFQAAESALREGEMYLKTAVIDDDLIVDAPPFATPTAPVVGEQKVWTDIGLLEPVWWSADPHTAWWQTAAHSVADPTGEFANQYAELPTYVIEYVLGVSASGVGESSNGNGSVEALKYYRITARGVGVTTSNISILQSIYLK